MNPDKNLQKQIDELKRRMDALNASQTIPLSIDKSFEGRGFSKVQIVTGKVLMPVSNSVRIPIPGATLQSVPILGYSDLNGTDNGQANIVPGLDGNSYDLLIEADATDVVWYVVFLNPPFTDFT